MPRPRPKPQSPLAYPHQLLCPQCRHDTLQVTTGLGSFYADARCTECGYYWHPAPPSRFAHWLAQQQERVDVVGALAVHAYNDPSWPIREKDVAALSAYIATSMDGYEVEYWKTAFLRAFREFLDAEKRRLPHD